MITVTIEDDTSSRLTEASSTPIQDGATMDTTTLNPFYQSNLGRALYLGSVELTENLLHPLILLLLAKNPTSPALFIDIGILAPSLMFRMLNYIPLSNLLPMAREANAQPAVKASVYFVGAMYAGLIASAYPSLYQYYDGTRLAEFNQQQLHAMHRLNNAQRIDIITQLMKIILIDNNQQRQLLLLTMFAGIMQISYIAMHTNPGLDDYVTGVQLNSITRLLLLSLSTVPLLRQINIPFTQYRISISNLTRSAWQLTSRSTPIIMQNLIAFNIVSTVASKLHHYDLIGLNHVLVSLADLDKSFIHGMAIASQSQIAKTYLSEPMHATRMGQQVIVQTLILSSLLPLLYAAVTYYYDKNNMGFFIWMGFISMLSTLENIMQELIKGINFNFAPNVINSAVSFLVPYALLNLDNHSHLQEFSIPTVLQVAVTLRTCVVLGTWFLRMRHLTLNQHDATTQQPYVRQIDHSNNTPEPHSDIENPTVIAAPVSNLSYLRNTGYRLTNQLSSLFYWREPRPVAPSATALVQLQPAH